MTSTGSGSRSSKATQRKRKVATRDEPDCIDLREDDEPQAPGSSVQSSAASRKTPAVSLPTVSSVLGQLDELHKTQEGGEQKAVKRPVKTKKSVEKRGWSKGTGFGGSHEVSKKDEDSQQRARSREEHLDASFTTLSQQLLKALERQNAPENEMCHSMLSCAGLGWGLHRLLSNQSLLEIGRRNSSYKPMLALLSFLSRSDQRSGVSLY